jgi:hypothetical protein
MGSEDSGREEAERQDKLYDARALWIRLSGTLTTLLGLGMVVYGFYLLIVTRKEEEAIKGELEEIEEDLGGGKGILLEGHP